MDMNNTDNLKSFEISLRTGWKDEEKLLLWEQVKAAQKVGAPLKQVFETVALKTGRKPNSVRNYYYMKVKETGEIEKKPATFIPFSKEEVYFLLKELLSSGAKGESIRGASLRLAGNDKTLMLRYQNKYRSLIKSQKNIVERVMADMDNEGIRYVNPYNKKKTAAAKDAILPDSLIDQLKTSGVDVRNFFGGLKKMASLAASYRQNELKLKETAMVNMELKNENEELSRKIEELNAKLKSETEKNSNTASLLRKLIKMSSAKELSEFSGLSEWLKESAAGSAEAL